MAKKQDTGSKKKVRDINKILLAAKETNLTIKTDKKEEPTEGKKITAAGKNVVENKTEVKPVEKEYKEKEEILILTDDNYYEFVFERKESNKLVNAVRLENGIYDILKRLHIVYNIPTAVMVNNIVFEWIEKNRPKIDKDLKKLSKY